MNRAARGISNLDELAGLFYSSPEELGRFDEVAADEMPAEFRRQLAHELHMTVTVEAFHGCRVDVRVLRKRSTPTHYAREILLLRQSDALVVQHGIMRVNLAYLDDAVRREILAEGTPLGRVLIEHNVMREIQLNSLWRVTPAARLAKLFDLEQSSDTYGRTALIHVDGEPAVELVEIVRPLLQ